MHYLYLYTTVAGGLCYNIIGSVIFCILRVAAHSLGDVPNYISEDMCLIRLYVCLLFYLMYIAMKYVWYLIFYLMNCSGLNNAGKTTILYQLKNGVTPITIPTVGKFPLGLFTQ